MTDTYEREQPGSDVTRDLPPPKLSAAGASFARTRRGDLSVVGAPPVAVTALPRRASAPRRA